MKIPRKLPQFSRTTAYIIVAGKQDAAFYSASDGIIERLDAFKIPRPRYSDKEGRFGVRGKGGGNVTGGVLELRDEDIIRDFIKELKVRLKSAPSFEHIYLFAPADTKNRIAAALQNSWKEKVRATIVGNYYYRHPLIILEKIAQEIEWVTVA